MKKFLLVLSIAATPFYLKAQSNVAPVNPLRPFELGEVTIKVNRLSDSVNSVSARQIEKFNRTEISTALNILPGVTIANVGPRNESVVYVRGFDLRQVPVFIDGVPVYVPYDGYVDMGRFTTFDLAQVNVSKGFASILYGANTMGGAINLVTAKPDKPFSLNGRVGAFSGGGFRWNVNAGSRLGKIYYQVGLSQIKQDHYPLSKDFQLRKYQTTYDRENSYRDDKKLSLKVGFTPNATDEYAIGYSYQQGEKGNPPYVGNDPKITTRFWQWPKWNKQSLYFISNTALGSRAKVKSRFYYDTFVNELFSYDDTTYTTQKKRYAFQSYYDDYTFGGNVELETQLSEKNQLKANVQYKRDVHREHDLNEPVQTYSDNTFSVGLEDYYRLAPTLTVVPGISFNTRGSGQAQEYNASTGELSDFKANNNSAVNAQLGLFWNINSTHSLSGSVARKTRFATIKDRYSYRMGAAIPNPDLKAENALNYDVTYNGKIVENIRIGASLYYSRINDIIQQVDNVEPNKFQLQNAGKATFYGSEVSFDYQILKALKLGANYTYTHRENNTNPAILFTNVPEHKVFTYVDLSLFKRLDLLASLEYDSERNSTSYGTTAGAYTLVNLKADIKIIKQLNLEGGVNNLFDRNYALVEGFPAAGRNYFISLAFHF